MASLALHLKSHPHKPSQSLLKSSTFSLFFSSSSNNNNNDNNNNNKNIPSYFSDHKSRLQQQPPFRGGADGGGGGEEGAHVKHYPFSDSLTDIAAKLKQHEQQQQQSQGFRPSIFGSNTSPSGSDYNDKIRRNLSEFRSRVASGGSSSPLEKRTQRVTFDDIKESLSMIRKSVNVNNKGKNMINSMSFNSNLSSIKPQQGATMPNLGGGGGNVLGGSALPMGVFGKEMKEKEMKIGEGGGDGGDGGGEEMWMRGFDYDVLGKKLRELRPEVKGKKEKGEGEGFSISELNERLMKVKENAKKESDDSSGLPFSELKRTLQTMLTDAKTNTNTLPIQGLDILGPGTPSFMLSPPKEHLVEKYFHPDNMSAVEKLKLELKKVRDEFKMHESDCGSTRVQIAQLTTEILHLSSVLLKKDKHSRRGLQAKVQQRKKLLKYLRRTDWESYCFVLSKLGLRDNPDYKN